MRAIVLADLDNTFYNWVDFFAPSFRGMLHAVSQRTGIAEDVLRENFRAAYRLHGSLEYQAAAQDLEIFGTCTPSELSRLNELIFGSFRKVAGSKLRLYEGASRFLNWCYSVSVPVFAVTNAPLTIAERRLVRLGINRYFGGLAAPNILPKTKTRLLDDNATLFEMGPSQRVASAHFGCVYALDEREIKPSAAGYRRVLQDWAAEDTTIYVIGDSLTKDLLPAVALSAVTIWAKFGTAFKDESIQTLFGITPWSAEQVKVAYDESFQPRFTADSWSAILDFVQEDMNSRNSIERVSPGYAPRP